MTARCWRKLLAAEKAAHADLVMGMAKAVQKDQKAKAVQMDRMGKADLEARMGKATLAAPAGLGKTLLREQAPPAMLNCI